MPEAPRPSTVQLLARCQEGDAGASADLFELLSAELRAIAGKLMADQRASHTLQPTALVHEAWLRLVGKEERVEGRGHFLRLAATAMRSVLVDHARQRLADKRGGGGKAVDLEPDATPATRDGATELIALHEALEKLARRDPDAARVAELRCFGGLDHAATAEAVGTSVRSVERLWRKAREFLKAELDGPTS